MTKDEFKILHSELIMYVQMIETDLRYIYAAMKPGSFEKNVDYLEHANLGIIIKELRTLDASDGYPDLSDTDYRLLNRIRELRNYWCHQCYPDFMYVSDECMREERFLKIAERLSADAEKAKALRERIRVLRNVKLKEYRSV